MAKSTCAIITVCFTCIQLWSNQYASAQQPPLRYTGGWSASTRTPPATAPQSSSPVVQASFYQAAGGGLPPFPGANNVTPPVNYQDAGPSQPSLPAMPNALQNAPQGMNNYGDPRNAGNAPAPLPQYNQPAFDPYATQTNQVLPPPNPYRTVAAGDSLRAVQNTANNAAPQGDSNGLRPVAPTMPSGFGPNARPMEIATGYPFVSPAPVRTGNYPTSAYNPSLFRTVAYQNVVQTPLQTAPLSAAIANTQPTLPQYQGAPLATAPVPVAPGVYPTQYQCAPGAVPTYPGPGAVPGTYVPATITPNLTPGNYTPNNSGYTPLLSLGQENYNVQIGRGIIGQPTVYVPGQPFRNFFRYLSP